MSTLTPEPLSAIARTQNPQQQAGDIPSVPDVAVLTGGADRPYALGLARALAACGQTLEFVGSDEVTAPDIEEHPSIRFLNLRGDQRPEASLVSKLTRVARYYARLLVFAASSRAKVFHILWNNKWEFFDRVILTGYYRLLGRRVVLTAHNVNKAERDGNDSAWNRATLKTQYSLVNHIFVHTEKSRDELCTGFSVPRNKVEVIPFGVNDSVPDTELSGEEARHRLGLGAGDKVLLFFGNIAPYKGVEFLVEAVTLLGREIDSLKLVIAGRPKGAEDYWQRIETRLREDAALAGRVVQRIEYIPDAETEVYFKAADAFVLPYTHIFQSGVLFLGYGFGVPAICTDVGALREDVVEGETGLLAAPQCAPSLAAAIRSFFGSRMYERMAETRGRIRQMVRQRNSWEAVAKRTVQVYRQVTGLSGSGSDCQEK
jgi:glycosyltransferase involved in cell wall biosynthesis